MKNGKLLESLLTVLPPLMLSAFSFCSACILFWSHSRLAVSRKCLLG